jgi:shikimate dehydrogenase
MKYALIGKSISHSRSPELYREIFSEDIEYDLLEVPSEADLPQLSDLARLYNGINITSPYKRSYFSLVLIQEPEVQELGAINTISFSEMGWIGTNTDLYAVEYILRKFIEQFPELHLIILGSGVMGTLTSIVAKKLQLSYQVLDRRTGLFPNLDLRPYHKTGSQNVVINACSRDFIFSGEINESTVFWDYNYDLAPHQSTLPNKVTLYLDGQDMLLIQAKAAAVFWKKFI